MLAKLYDETKAVIKIVKQLMIEVMNNQHTVILKKKKTSLRRVWQYCEISKDGTAKIWSKK